MEVGLYDGWRRMERFWTQHPLVAQTAERCNMLHLFHLLVMVCTDKLATVQ